MLRCMYKEKCFQKIKFNYKDFMANDLWHDMKVLNSLYEELMWDNDDEIQFRIEDERIVIRNVTVENE